MPLYHVFASREIILDTNQMSLFVIQEGTQCVVDCTGIQCTRPDLPAYVGDLVTQTITACHKVLVSLFSVELRVGVVVDLYCPASVNNIVFPTAHLADPFAVDSASLVEISPTAAFPAKVIKYLARYPRIYPWGGIANCLQGLDVTNKQTTLLTYDCCCLQSDYATHR